MSQPRTICRETAHRIWLAHREIEIAEKLIIDITETLTKDNPETPTERSAQRFLQLGIPSGGMGGHRLVDVSPVMARALIQEHIMNQRDKLISASREALREMNGDPEEA